VRSLEKVLVLEILKNIVIEKRRGAGIIVIVRKFGLTQKLVKFAAAAKRTALFVILLGRIFWLAFLVITAVLYSVFH